ncbi:MAG: hypothetical protein A2Y91_05110 [Chloroflexi bacterium RBG_13_54_8]|nr:MAG: hypothetical protein A2Y91_05110 [Chloroflexi bacterium RBG_13_54_8]
MIRHLSDTDNGSFLYRGQIKRYEGPLLPSAFRGILQENPVISGSAADSAKSMRKVGRRFIGNFVWDKEDYHLNAMTHLTRSPQSPHKTPARTPRDADAYFKAHFKSQGSIATFQQQSDTALETLLQSTTSTVEFNSLSERQGCRQAVVSMIQKTPPSFDANHPTAKWNGEGGWGRKAATSALGWRLYTPSSAPGATIEVSWLLHAVGDEGEREGIECECVAAHRWLLKANPACQFIALERRNIT